MAASLLALCLLIGAAPTRAAVLDAGGAGFQDVPSNAYYADAVSWALEEDITSEDVSANAVMDKPCRGEVELLCKQSGVIAGLQVFARVFQLLDDTFAMGSFC